MTGWLVTFAVVFVWAGILLYALCLCAVNDEGDRRCTDEDQARMKLYPDRRQ